MMAAAQPRLRVPIPHSVKTGTCIFRRKPKDQAVAQAEAERHQRILSEVSRALLDYVGPDEVEPLRRIVHKVTEGLGDWCAFALVQPDGTLKNVATWHPDPAQRDVEDQINQLVPPRPWNDGPPQYN